MRSFLLWLVILAALLGGGYFLANSMIDRSMKQGIDIKLAKLSRTFEITYDRVHYNMLTQQSELYGIRARVRGAANTLKIEKAVLLRIDDEFPNIAHFTATGVQIEQLTNLPIVRQRLDALGLGDLPLDLELDYEYDSYKNRVEVRNLTLKAENLGQIKLAFELLEFDARDFKLKEEGFNPLAVLDLTLKMAQVEYDDRGLATRIIEQESAAAGQRPEVWIEAQMKLLSEQYDTAANPSNAQLAGSLERFLRSPATLKVVARPTEPASLVQLIFTRRAKIPQVLGTQVTN